MEVIYRFEQMEVIYRFEQMEVTIWADGGYISIRADEVIYRFEQMEVTIWAYFFNFFIYILLFYNLLKILKESN
jgi:hypothetical protein